MSDLAGVFAERYQEWQRHCSRSEVSESSSDRAYIDDPSFAALVALGEEAVPLIIDKLGSDPDAHFLVHALARITGVRFAAEELAEARREFGDPLGNQGLAQLWLRWWQGWR